MEILILKLKAILEEIKYWQSIEANVTSKIFIFLGNILSKYNLNEEFQFQNKYTVVMSYTNFISRFRDHS